jgi:Na+/H+ antiporter NhaD/arsenite permease-like protein
LEKIIKFLKDESVLAVLLILLALLSFLVPGHIREYFSFIDYKTIITLLALIIVATAIKQSGYFDLLAGRLLKLIHDERTLVTFMVSLSAVLSMFLTNDIALFITVPLTACMQNALKNDLVKTVIFEAIAVNTGSTLTPMGNPQNLYLWNGWGISFFGFAAQMFVPFLVMSGVLALFILLFVKNNTLDFHSGVDPVRSDPKLTKISFILMALFFIALQFKAGYYMLPVIILVYIFFHPAVFRDVDWLLILTFMLIFIDFTLAAKLPVLEKAVSMLDMSSSRNVYTASVLVSQAISNVPAAIFISRFSGNWRAIAYGANIAGNGFIIGSLANIIAIRLLKPVQKGALLEFHKYSVPFFTVTGFILWFFL